MFYQPGFGFGGPPGGGLPGGGFPGGGGLPGGGFPGGGGLPGGGVNLPWRDWIDDLGEQGFDELMDRIFGYPGGAPGDGFNRRPGQTPTQPAQVFPRETKSSVLWVLVLVLSALAIFQVTQ